MGFSWHKLKVTSIKLIWIMITSKRDSVDGANPDNVSQDLTEKHSAEGWATKTTSSETVTRKQLKLGNLGMVIQLLDFLKNIMYK